VLDDLGEGKAADPWREEVPVLAGIAAAAMQGRRALGERAGAAVRRCGVSADLVALTPSGLGPCRARRNGFGLHASVLVPPRDRARLERLCRYALRPSVAHERIHLTPEGQLRHRWTDGTTHLVFDPLELLERRWRGRTLSSDATTAPETAHRPRLSGEVCRRPGFEPVV
jgi:Putative transposase